MRKKYFCAREKRRNLLARRPPLIVLQKERIPARNRIHFFVEREIIVHETFEILNGDIPHQVRIADQQLRRQTLKHAHERISLVFPASKLVNINRALFLTASLLLVRILDNLSDRFLPQQIRQIISDEEMRLRPLDIPHIPIIVRIT